MMPENRMTEEEFVSGFDEALERGDIFVVYQPQINHTTGRMIGAEALMRWKHPVYGVQLPSDFIPVLERNNLIIRADLYVFEQVCKLQRKCIDENILVVPISVNMSRYDIYNNDYVEGIEELRKKYDIPVKYLRIEITETSAIGGMVLISKVLENLHSYGYLVEMDDFGSGYSSLNILKDLEVDIIKLDMRFLSGGIGGRGGAIISSIVQMAKWLDTPVIAEGVEDSEQADFMKSIGCNYIQGYYYFKPMVAEDFIKELGVLEHEPIEQAMEHIKDMDAGKFWDPQSMETLIFSNFVGPAVIYSYENGKIEIIRVNEKYLKEIGLGQSEKELISTDPWEWMKVSDRDRYERKIKKAIETGEEVDFETWRTVCSKICGEEKICVRSNIRVIGKAGEQYLIYAMVQNITAEKKRFQEVADSERKFRFASEQANVYAWEYDVVTKKMRPCFRCMRDLGLPAVVENYPEPAIEAGIFPQDYADMYRDWHRQIAEGAEYLEAIIPLTVGRVPFHVRYTTEFDENGKPLKAYGSATLVVDDKKDE